MIDILCQYPLGDNKLKLETVYKAFARVIHGLIDFFVLYECYCISYGFSFREELNKK